METEFISMAISLVLLLFSYQVLSDSLWLHGLQHARPPCPFTVCQSLLKLLSTELVMPSNYLILCCPLLLLPSIFPSIKVFSKDSVLRIRWLKYWSFSFSISPSKTYSLPISFRIDWLDLLAVQGALKSLLQHHSSKASILWHSAFFMVPSWGDSKQNHILKNISTLHPYNNPYEIFTNTILIL